MKELENQQGEEMKIFYELIEKKYGLNNKYFEFCKKSQSFKEYLRGVENEHRI